MECDKKFSYFSLFFSFSLSQNGAYLPQALANKGIAPPAVHCGKFAKILKKFLNLLLFCKIMIIMRIVEKARPKKRAFLAFDYPLAWRAIMILWRDFARGIAIIAAACIVGLR